MHKNVVQTRNRKGKLYTWKELSVDENYKKKQNKKQWWKWLQPNMQLGNTKNMLLIYFSSLRFLAMSMEYTIKGKTAKEYEQRSSKLIISLKPSSAFATCYQCNFYKKKHKNN